MIRPIKTLLKDKYLPLIRGTEGASRVLKIASKHRTIPRQTAITIFGALFISALLFALPIVKSGPRNIAHLENIQGIPSATTGVSQNRPAPGGTPPLQPNNISEKLTHADIYLKEPVFAKQLHLTVTFTPQQAQSIAVGIRKQRFWLGYQRHLLYPQPNQPTDPTTPRTVTLTIPLTDKFQEPDRSIDLMFFTGNVTPRNYDDGIADTTDWQLHQLTATVTPALPILSQLVDYLASLALRERAA